MGRTKNYRQELLKAARLQLGKDTIKHQVIAGNCLRASGPDCMDVGLGPRIFDCSGLMIKTITDVYGLAATDWPLQLRHVRDLWREARERNVFEEQVIAVGSLVIMARYYNEAGTRWLYPGHTGIVVSVADNVPTVIHANIAKGVVEEKRLARPEKLIGTIGLKQGNDFGRGSLTGFVKDVLN